MKNNGYASNYQINSFNELRECVDDVLLNMHRTGEEQAFKVRLLLNELLSSVLDCVCGEEKIQMRVQCLCDKVKIDIDNAESYARQIVRGYEQMLVCGNAFEEYRFRLMLVRAMADELVFNVKDHRITAVVSTA